MEKEEEEDEEDDDDEKSPATDINGWTGIDSTLCKHFGGKAQAENGTRLS